LIWLMIATIRKQHKTTPNVRKLLTTRKTLTNLLDEAGGAADVYRDAAVKPGRYPSRTFCSVCGYWGRYRCTRCGEQYCGEGCAETHRGWPISTIFADLKKRDAWSIFNTGGYAGACTLSHYTM
jgi:hypothetical protein